jgi:hypothetical protein
VSHLERAGDAQAAALALRSELATAAATSRRHLACVRIVLASARWARNRRGCAFARWLSAAQLLAAESAVRERVTAAGEEAGAAARARQVTRRFCLYSTIQCSNNKFTCVNICVLV